MEATNNENAPDHIKEPSKVTKAAIEVDHMEARHVMDVNDDKLYQELMDARDQIEVWRERAAFYESALMAITIATDSTRKASIAQNALKRLEINNDI